MKFKKYGQDMNNKKKMNGNEIENEFQFYKLFKIK